MRIFRETAEAAKEARTIAKEHFEKLSKKQLEPFAFCFRDKNRHKIDDIVARMIGLDPDREEIQELLKTYRRLFCSEPNVNGRQQRIIKAVTDYHKE